MSVIAEILEQELEEAVEVKNKKSLHRYIVLLTENIVRKENYEKDHNEIKSDIKTLAEILKQGFERMDKRFEDVFRYMDKRFEAVDKRFEAVDKRFEDIYRYMDKRFEAVDKRFEDMNKKQSMMLTFMNLGFGIIILLTILFKFIV